MAGLGSRWKHDDRPQRYGWAPGEYIHGRCVGQLCRELEDSSFIGAKRAIICADCAYAMPDPVYVDRVGRHIDVVIADNPEKWDQAFARPQLLGWFVGQVMKRLNGAADPEEVYRKVCDKYGAKS
jgi:Asp-tRNA(Asn)/Glu-tRNA(Gln) amidotransferase B subunit